RAELGQEGDGFGKTLRVGVGLDARVVQLGPTAYGGPFDVDAGGPAAAVQLDGPQDGRPYLVGQQARGAFGEYRRVQWYPPVGKVNGLAPAPGLPGEGAVGVHVRGDVGDGVVHTEAPAVPAFQVHRLVRVQRVRRGRGGEREVG